MASLELPIPTLGDEPDIEELVARARSGGSSAFDALAKRVRGRVRVWASRLTGDRDDAEDVAQAVLLRLHRQLQSFEGRSQFTTWLYSMTTRVVLSRRALERRRTALLVERTNENEADTDASVTAGSSMQAASARDARVAALMASFLDELTGRQREVFELADLRGLDSVEIAKRLGAKPVTVRTQLMRARQRIRLRMLEAHPHLLEDYRDHLL